jgi:hypothetical protein
MHVLLQQRNDGMHNLVHLDSLALQDAVASKTGETAQQGHRFARRLLDALDEVLDPRRTG